MLERVRDIAEQVHIVDQCCRADKYAMRLHGNSGDRCVGEHRQLRRRLISHQVGKLVEFNSGSPGNPHDGFAGRVDGLGVFGFVGSVQGHFGAEIVPQRGPYDIV